MADQHQLDVLRQGWGDLESCGEHKIQRYDLTSALPTSALPTSTEPTSVVPPSAVPP